MVEFLKIFGEGFLFFLGLPFILIGLVVYGLYLFVVFIVMAIKNMVLFFKGKKFSLMLEEDYKADEILRNGINIGGNQPQVQTATNNSVTYNNTYNQINITPKQENSNEGLTKATFIDATNSDNLSGYIQGNDNNGN